MKQEGEIKYVETSLIQKRKEQFKGNEFEEKKNEI